MMGDAECKYFFAFRVDDKRQRYRSSCRHRGCFQSRCRVVVKHLVDIDDFVNQMTDMTPLIIPFVGGCGMVLCNGICCFAMAVCAVG